MRGPIILLSAIDIASIFFMLFITRVLSTNQYGYDKYIIALGILVILLVIVYVLGLITGYNKFSFYRIIIRLLIFCVMSFLSLSANIFDYFYHFLFEMMFMVLVGLEIWNYIEIQRDIKTANKTILGKGEEKEGYLLEDVSKNVI